MPHKQSQAAYAILGKTESALTWLRRASETGFPKISDRSETAVGGIRSRIRPFGIERAALNIKHQFLVVLMLV